MPGGSAGFRRALTRLKRVATICGAALVVLLIVSMYATELTRLVIREAVAPPIALPRGVDLRQSDRLVAFLGRGTSTGNAAAITLGHVIVVPSGFARLPLSDQRRIVAHELVHVRQRERYWRFYLPVYGLLYLVRGYEDHPFERQAHDRGL